MTLEEGIKAARSGDYNAMMTVANYYYQNDDVGEALKYAEMAGEEGVGKGMLMSMLLRSILASAARSLPAWDDVIVHCEKMFYWSQYILNLGETSDADMFSAKDYDTAYRYGLQALYIGGMAHWFRQEFRDAVGASEGLQNPQLQILHAISLFQIAASDDELNQVYEELKILETESYYPDDGDEFDDVVITAGAQTQALLYRSGITGTDDLSKAHQVLVTAYNLVRNPASKVQLSNEMSHYRMSRFGDFTYV